MTLASDSTSIRLHQVLGGVFVRLLRKAGVDLENINSIFRGMQESGFLVPVLFGAEDFVSIYALEGWAYEYWKFSAAMRAIGKGEKLTVVGGLPRFVRSDELDALLSSFDQRTWKSGFEASNLGAAFLKRPRPGDLHLMAAQYNVERRDAAEVGLAVLSETPVVGKPNFVLGPLDVRAFVDGHAFAADRFKAERGFTLEGLGRVLAALSMVALDLNDAGDGFDLRGLVRLYDRAYDLFRDADLEKKVASIGLVAPANFAVSDDERARVLESVTLSEQKQSQVSLWTRGPRFVLLPIQTGFLVDFTAFAGILMNAFFRIRFEDTVKGYAFEDEFRAYASTAGLQVLPDRKLNLGAAWREGDAFVRRGSVLFVCECRAMDRPLDVERGKPKVLEKRRAEFDEKLTQVDEVVSLLRAHPQGENYDFSWARTVIGIVVSPFVEWIWTRDSRLWLDDSTPRILSAREAVTYMLGQPA